VIYDSEDGSDAADDFDLAGEEDHPSGTPPSLLPSGASETPIYSPHASVKDEPAETRGATSGLSTLSTPASPAEHESDGADSDIFFDAEEGGNRDQHSPPANAAMIVPKIVASPESMHCSPAAPTSPGGMALEEDAFLTPYPPRYPRTDQKASPFKVDGKQFASPIAYILSPTSVSNTVCARHSAESRFKVTKCECHLTIEQTIEYRTLKRMGAELEAAHNEAAALHMYLNALKLRDDDVELHAACVRLALQLGLSV
jgi:hypothetical protein